MRSYEEKKAETERLLALLPDVRDRLIGIPGVTKVAVGVRERGGELTDEFVFRVHVEQKLPADEVPADQMVPAEVAGVPTDVVVRRRPVPEIGFGDEDDWTSYSPKVGGSRLGAEVAGGTGTLGCFCERTSDGKVVFLSNWHVLIDPGGANGDGVGHPKWWKSCCCTTGKIGEVVDFDEDLDCAIGLLDSGVTYAPKIRRIKRADGTTELEGRIEGSAAPVADDEVWKVGARTGLTRGTITDIDPEEIEVTPLAAFPRMSNKGDSGSVYVSLASGNVCGLHRAGDAPGPAPGLRGPSPNRGWSRLRVLEGATEGLQPAHERRRRRRSRSGRLVKTSSTRSVPTWTVKDPSAPRPKAVSPHSGGSGGQFAACSTADTGIARVTRMC